MNNKVFWRMGGELNTQAMTIEEWDRRMTDAAAQNSSGSTTTTDADGRTRALTKNVEPLVVDEVPPFDITISMANEYGKAACMILYGVEILDNGSQFSMDNIISQQAQTFVARRMKSLYAVQLSA